MKHFTLLLFSALILQIFSTARANSILGLDSDYHSLSPRGNFISIFDGVESIIIDAKTLQKRFILSEASQNIRFFSQNDQYFYYTDENEGFFRLNLSDGKTEQLHELQGIELIYEDSNTGALYFCVREGDWQISNALKVFRLDQGKPAYLIATFTPEKDLSIGAFELFSHKDEGKLLVHITDLGIPQNMSDSPEYGASRFVSLDVRTGATETLSTFPKSTGIEYRPIRPIEADSTVFELANAHRNYVLLDPYIGEVTRIIEIPGVSFRLDRQGLVIAERVEKEAGGEYKYFLDYLQSGSLKTLHNFQVANHTDFFNMRLEGNYQPEAPTQWFSESNILKQIDKKTGQEMTKFTLDYRRISIIGNEPNDPNTLLLVVGKDTSSGLDVIRYNVTEKRIINEAASATIYKFESFAFHPNRPEFFAIDGQGNVHFFRISRSGIQHSLRGQEASKIDYSNDGEYLYAQELSEGVRYRYDPDTFPLDPEQTRVEFPTSPPMVPLGNYRSEIIQSANQKWLLQLDEYDAYLYSYENPGNGIQIDYHGVAREFDRTIDKDLVAYSFAPNESSLFRLITRFQMNYDTDTLESRSTLSAFTLSETIEASPEAAWTIELDNRFCVFAGYSKDNTQIRLFNKLTGSLEYYDLTNGTTLHSQTTPLKIPERYLDPEARYNQLGAVYNEDKDLLVLYGEDDIFGLQFGSTPPRSFTIPTTTFPSAIHFPAGADLLAFQDNRGSLHFHSITTGEALQELAKLTFYNGGEDYLLQASNGRFDATRIVIEGGYYQKGMTLLPLSQIFDKAYEPTLLPQILSGIKLPAQALEFAEIVRAPTTNINHSRIIKEEMLLKLSADSPKGNLAELHLYQNQKLIKSFDVLGNSTFFKEHTVHLLNGPNTFSLIAVNAEGIQSSSSETSLALERVDQNGQGDAPDMRQLHLLVVGINEYQNPKYSLNYALPDARSILDKLNGANSTLYEKVNTYSIYDSEATAENILAEFEKVRAAAKPQDTFIFYFAGHGVMSKETGHFYLVPTNVTQIYGESDTLQENGISSQRLRQLAETIQAQKQVFILDACNSGGALEVFSERGASQEKALAQLARATGTHWLTASSSAQFATEFAELGHGAFTYALLEGLSGAADSGDARVSINELKAYLESELPRITKEYKGTPQYPTSYGYGRDFPVALKP